MSAVLVPVAREGWPFIGGFAAISLVLMLIAEPLGWIGVVLTAWCVYFFRNPDRVTPARTGLVISPADGVVQMIADVAPPPELDMGTEPRTRVSVFMNVFDCHVNRIPIDGRIGRLSYVPGRFVNAALDKASEENERQLARVDMADGRSIGFVQIAGLVARRIICYLQEDQAVRAGERFGLIRFGSRVDVYLPAGTAPQVAIGQRAIAGETVLADLNASEGARSGEIR
ncbi:MAG: phosphatidylserine decarboxylase [Rhodospirillaceae bacterium]|nr:phosphatidylserine decarboxylase [Rhodospirillaceae bacterium]MBT6137397.1 phosphatidylserine decarboxylase [Rhodospirillaceae bacterium]